VIGNLIGSGAAEFPRFLTSLVSKIFGVSRSGAKALLPGLFAGFPVGVSAAVRLYERGVISKNEFDRISAFSCTPGGAFIISGVGEGLFNDKKIGIIIYLSVIFSVFAVGFLYKLFGKSESKDVLKITLEDAGKTKFTDLVSGAVTKSANAMIVMSAFVLFFSQITFFVSEILTNVNAPAIVEILLKAILEISQACRASSALPKANGIIIVVIASAWGGLSLHMQTFALCTKNADSRTVRKLVFLRACIATVSVIICAVFCKVGKIT